MLKAYVMICTLWQYFDILLNFYKSISKLILKIPWITSDMDYDVLRFEISSEKRILKS